MWGDAGTGKTTTIKKTINELVAEGKIAGCVYVTPSAVESESTTDWLEAATTDMFGPIVPKTQKISKILGYDAQKPYVIVLDQIEGYESITAKLEALVRALAYDSDDCKAYICLVVTSDVHLAEEMYSWNGGTKISFLGH